MAATKSEGVDGESLTEMQICWWFFFLRRMAMEEEYEYQIMEFVFPGSLSGQYDACCESCKRTYVVNGAEDEVSISICQYCGYRNHNR